MLLLIHLKMTMLNYQVTESDVSREWLVMIHGAGGSLKTWKYQQEYLSRHFNLLILDLRDHGLSKNLHPPYHTYTFQLISEDILAVMQHLEVTRAHFMSLSLGSVITQDFAIRYPHMIQSAVIAGGVFSATKSLRWFVQLGLSMNRFLPYRLMYALFSYLVMPHRRNQFARKVYQQQARLLQPSEYAKWLGLYSEFFSLLEGFYQSQLPFPMHVIMGKEDYIFLAGARKFVASQQLASLTEIPNCGHICNIECAEQFNQLAMAFLSRRSDIHQPVNQID